VIWLARAVRASSCNAIAIGRTSCIRRGTRSQPYIGTPAPADVRAATPRGRAPRTARPQVRSPATLV